MSVTIDDLKPKNFKVTIKGLELESKPVRLNHALTMAKVGTVLQEPTKYKKVDIDDAQKSLDGVFTDLIPDLAGVELGMKETTELMSQLLATIDPDDNKELREHNVDVGIDTDPKV